MTVKLITAAPASRPKRPARRSRRKGGQPNKEKLMTTTVKRIALGVGASLVALGVTAGVYARTQDQNTNQDPRPFRGRGMGPGGPGGRGGPMGPGGPGGPMGMLPMFGPRLGLTDEQKDQVKSIVESHKESGRPSPIASGRHMRRWKTP